MNSLRKVAIWAAAIVASAVLARALLPRLIQAGSISVKGTVIRQDADPRKELPLAGVEITLARGETEAVGNSDASGFFDLTLLRGINPLEPFVLRFRHPEYQPLDLEVTATDKLYVARMAPA